MTEEATTAKRAEIAKGIRENAAKLDGNAKMLRLFESLCYEPNEDAKHTATLMLGAFVTDMKNTPADKLESKKGEIMQVTKALRYLTQWQFLPADIEAKKELEAIIKAQDWEPKPKPKKK